MRSRHPAVMLAIACVAWLVTAVTTAHAQLRRQDGTWIKLGEQTVSLGQDFDTIAVGRREGRFKAIKLIVRGNEIYMEDLRVTYGNGQSEDLVVRKRVPANSESAAIDLQGEARFIEKIEMAYRARPGGGRATVEVYGLPQIDEQKRDEQVAGWREIDVQRVNLSSARVEMPAGREEGRHARLRLRVLEEPLFIRKVTVVYARGDSQELSYRGVLEPGEASPALDLDTTRARSIDRVVVELRPQIRNRGTATLQLYGDNAGGTAYRPPVDDHPWARGGQVFTDIPNGWVLFGSKAADFAADRDTIYVGRQFGRFDKVAIRVRENDVFIRDIRFVYANGESDHAEIRQVVPANTRTREIQLKGDRFLERIELSYQTRQGAGRRAQIEAYGIFANNWLGEQGEGQKHNQGWILLGAKTASMFKSDSDNIIVGQQFGAFRKIQLTARRNKVDIKGVQITYGNGEVEDVPISGALAEGASSAVYELTRGRGRHIQSIAIRHQSRLSLDGNALVEVWGMH